MMHVAVAPADLWWSSKGRRSGARSRKYSLPSYIGRFDHGHDSDDRGGRGAEARKPIDYLQQVYVDTMVYSTENLAHLIEVCGVSQVVLGTDHPFGMMNQNPIAHLLSVPGLSDADIESILSGTVSRLLKLEHRKQPKSG